MSPVHAFGFATLTSAGLIALAAILGGAWIWTALVYMTLFAWALDKLIAVTSASADQAGDFSAANRLSVGLGLVHFILLGLVVWALTQSGHGAARWVGLFLAAGLFFGQVSNANAHELIHRSDRRLFALGKWIYISLLFGHHTSAHLKVHHRLAATLDDPNTARSGESFYAFARRAWRGSFTQGYARERADIIRRGTGGATPYATYVGGAFAVAIVTGVVFGVAAHGAFLALVAYTQLQLLLSDYVQHYGLTRARCADGTLEPMGRAHSWNAKEWFTARLMLAAPYHSDHHAHPARPYPALALPDPGRAPRLPASLPVMSVLALYPAGWRRVMQRALDAWTGEART